MRIFISTAIPYVNEPPHAGFALEIVQADVIARYHRLFGEKVFFLTGTDENALKNVQAAKEEGISVKELVDRNSSKFYQLKTALNLSFDDFIRTSELRHKKGAQKLWQACQKDIYKKKYRGLYCLGCEAFYKEKELENGLCPEHKRKPELIEEENYFFSLSKYQEKLKEIIEKGEIEIIPEARKKEILSFINSGLEDISISRSAERAKGWGIEVPGDASQYLWVWFDALSNYINALGYGENGKKFQEFWQENKNKLHFIGKGVSRFHCLYWPAFLLSAKISLPRKIFIHGYLTSGGQKMSKSLGNVIDPFQLVEKYGTDPVRYFLLREIPPTEDGDFTFEKFEKRYNSDLVKGLGNLVARVLTMAERTKIKEYSHIAIQSQVDQTWEDYKETLENFKFHEALIAIWDLISFADGYIEKERPWEAITILPTKERDQKSLSQRVAISNLLFILANIAQMLQPFLPETSEKIFAQLGIKPKKPWQFKIKKEKPLFLPVEK